MKSDNLPSIRSYGDYSNYNYGAHCMRVDIPPSRKGKHGITLYFSYETIVAFNGVIDGKFGCRVVHKNDWGTTTGKHLNMIDGGAKDKRVDDKEFEKLYKKALKNA